MNLVDLIGICGWCIRFDQRCMDICRGKTNNIHTFHWFMWQKYDDNPSICGLESIRKKRKKAKHRMACNVKPYIFVLWISSCLLYLCELQFRYQSRIDGVIFKKKRTKKKQQKNTNDWDFNIQFRIWLFWISIIQQLKWHSQLTH